MRCTLKLAGRLINPKALLLLNPTVQVLDLCAAPGGKATLLATDSAAMAGHGHLLAVDNDFPRLQRLLHNARTQLLPGKVKDNSASAASLVQGRSTVIGNMTIVQADGRHLKADARGMPLPEDWDQAPAAGVADHKGRPSAKGGPFDRVLVDAPCSSSGRGQQPLSQEQLGRHVQRQRQLLWNAAALLRNGGTLVYSTCRCTLECCRAGLGCAELLPAVCYRATRMRFLLSLTDVLHACLAVQCVSARE